MNLFKSVRASTLTLGIAAGVLMSSQAAGQTAQSDADSGKWQFTGIIYGWLPTIGGKLSVPVADGGASINVDAKTIIDHLKMGFIGALEAHNGRWGAFTDVLYLDIGGSKSNVRDFSIGNIGLPSSTTADLSLDLKATDLDKSLDFWTSVLGFRLERRVEFGPPERRRQLAYAGLGDVQLARSLSKAHVPRGGLEHVKRVQRRKRHDFLRISRTCDHRAARTHEMCSWYRRNFRLWPSR